MYIRINQNYVKAEQGRGRAFSVRLRMQRRQVDDRRESLSKSINQVSETSVQINGSKLYDHIKEYQLHAF